MQSLEHLLLRQSHGKLTHPAPTQKQIEAMMQVALRAPDHAGLKPWRYQIFTGRSLETLADYFVQASLAVDPTLNSKQVEKIRNKTFRAPMIVVAIANITEHKKVPKVEQILSVGASVQNLLMAAHFSGVGAIWRSGQLCFNPRLMELLTLNENQTIVGFIYLGQEQGNKRSMVNHDQSEYVEWK